MSAPAVYIDTLIGDEIKPAALDWLDSVIRKKQTTELRQNLPQLPPAAPQRPVSAPSPSQAGAGSGEGKAITVKLKAPPIPKGLAAERRVVWVWLNNNALQGIYDKKQPSYRQIEDGCGVSRTTVGKVFKIWHDAALAINDNG